MILGAVLLLAAVAVIWSRIAGLEQRLRELERSLAQFQRDTALARSEASAKRAAAPQPSTQSPAAPMATPTTPAPSVPAASPRAPVKAAAVAADDAMTEAEDEERAKQARERDWQDYPHPDAGLGARSPPPESMAVKWLREYFTGGNLVVRVGIIVLFFGVAFLLKYAAEHSRLPIEARLIGVAVGAMGLFVVGWRLRERRRGFSLSLQGGAVGLMYLTVFAAYRLYHLVPSGFTFALLAVIGVASGLLALKQDALSFAMLGAAGGFLAPVLASTGRGSHVALFSYYALLDVGIVAMAWFRAWRPLNLLAFVFTFGIGTYWGVTQYIPAQFASTEPFLIFYFLAFVAIAVLFALRRAPQLTHYVDGTLVFGTPVVAMGLQFGLIRDIAYGRAFSALAAAAIYLVLAWWLHRSRRDTVRLLVESFLALGVALLTLAVPLALDGHWTAATWALEGTAIFWMGLRQRRLLPTASGLLLQLGAGVALASHLVSVHSVLPVLNAPFMGELFISVAGLVSARLALRPSGLLDERRASVVSTGLLAWGLLWGLFAGARELELFLPARWLWGAELSLLAIVAFTASWVASRLAWPALRIAGLLLLPAMLLVGLYWGGNGAHPFAQAGWLGWPLAFASLAFTMRRHEASVTPRLVATMHLLAFYLLALLASWESYWVVQRYVAEGAVWALVAWVVPLVLLMAALVHGAGRRGWPVSAHRQTYERWGALGLFVVALIWSVWSNFDSDGSASPLPYIPILNPLDLMSAIALVLGARWLMAVWRDPAGIGKDLLPVLLAGELGVTFLWLNGVLLRTLHHWLGIPYQVESLVDATEVQTALSIFWTVLALGTMLWATRTARRIAWFIGAGLMGVVLAKLFLVDLARVGTIPRIVSFLGVGGLMLVIGYYSPLPPDARKEST